MPEVKQTKVPLRRVSSDDFAVVVGGEEYHPHAGEWVEFKGSPSVEETLTLLKFSDIPSTLTAEDVPLVKAILEEITVYLERSVIKWNWTDADKRPYPTPDGVLRSLSFDEIGYLVEKAFAQLPPEQQKKVRRPRSRARGG
ncbi:hypothetical protein LCGC14_1243590 [marine sediment metagenome]|uniref:Uncharacterized protein n=1 Tax=marine sediment metagenome TaxID=412755 RepID=A0A0F9NMC8_9ZZZZ